MPQRRIIVNLATSADGFIARPDGDLDWLTERTAPAGGYGLAEFARTVDAKILGRRTFDRSRELGARFRDGTYYVFSRQPPADSVPTSVQWVADPIGDFVERVRKESGKDLWLMGGGGIIGAFLDADAIDAFIITAVPVLLGEGIPLLGPKHRTVALQLVNVEQFPDGVVQRHYEVQRR